MLDRADSCRPERRSALIAHKLSRLNIDIAALSEIRFSGEGSLQEHGAGYTLYWSGKPETERRLSGVDFMVRNSIASKLVNQPTGHSDRIISMRLPLWNQQYATLFSVYSPTLKAEPAEKDRFYSDLRSLIQSTPADDKVVILGDFNARVGQDSKAWKGVLRKHGVGNCNENGRLLLEFCAEKQFTITNTIFQQKNSLKTTWIHPRSKNWHLIDYVLVRQRDIQDVCHTRVMPSAECYTDHRLVRCKLRLLFKPKPRKGGPPKKKFKVGSFQSAERTADFQAGLQLRLVDSSCQVDPPLETLWVHLKTAISQTAEEVLGYTIRKKKDWLYENNQDIQELLTQKRSAHQAHLAQPSCPEKKAAFRLVCSKLQRKLREIQNEWWTNLAKSTQMCADAGDYRVFYEALKAVYGPMYQVRSPLRSSDGLELPTNKTAILSRWSEHFQALFNANRTVEDSVILRIPQQPVKAELDNPPSFEETTKAIKQIKCGKAAGVDGIPPEAWKRGGPALHCKLHELFLCCWEQGKLPQDLRDAVIITLYKNKGEKSNCDNYRGITLLSIAGNFFRKDTAQQTGAHNR